MKVMLNNIVAGVSRHSQAYFIVYIVYTRWQLEMSICLVGILSFINYLPKKKITINKRR